MEDKTYEKQLPEAYSLVKHINAKDIKFGIVFNLIALLVWVVVMFVAVLPIVLSADKVNQIDESKTMSAYIVLFVSMFLYIVLHELVHGIAYKRLTGEKLTFGFSWSCAFCGVPHIYVYRKTALIALASPLIVFSIIFLASTIALFYVDVSYYLVSAFLFGLHLGGCSGDIYVMLLLLTRYKDKSFLMRDTGPEQYFYLKDKH